MRRSVPILFLFAFASAAAAQGDGSIVGRVTDARTTRPVAGATLEVEGTRLGAVANDDGRYRITGAAAGARTLVVRRLGYAMARQAVTVAARGETTADIVLTPAAIALEQIVVTGTAGGDRLRSVGNSVARIAAADAVSLGEPPNLSGLLNARAPGLVVNSISGRLGTGPSINIRGRSSIGLGDAPLIYIDGVRVNNATGTGPAGGGGFGSQGATVAGRLNDINADDIESIEVIKGPAASTIYGTEATSGVIQVTTKKGAVGAKPTFALSVQQGSIWFRDPEGRMPTNYMRDPTGAIVPFNAVTQEQKRGTPLFTAGRARTIGGSLSGGRESARYYLSSTYQDEQGVEPNNALKQFSTHANLDLVVTPDIDAGVSLNFVDLRGRLGTDLGASTMLGAIGAHPLLFPASRGFAFGFPPEVSWKLWDNTENVTRFTASGTLSHRPTAWLSQRLVMGLDYTGDDSRVLERFAPPDLAIYLTPTAATGRMSQNLRRALRISTDWGATAHARLTESFGAATSVGVQAFRTETSNSSLGGTGFPGPGVETVAATSTALPATQTQALNTTVGGYVQEKFSWRDRLFFTAALRVDNNSAFGQAFKWVTYPKFDASWVVNEEPFWTWRKWVNTLRLRAAYGESGQSPTTFSALRTFTPTQGPGSTSAVTPGSLGNPDLKPERGKELEVGFEAEFMNRLSVDVTWFSKKTVDAIVNQPVPPSSGFPGTIPLNLGRVDNSGVELQATLSVLERPRFAWSLTASYATNGDVIKNLGIVPGAITSAGAANRLGYPIGGIWTRRVVSADRDTAGKATNLLCDGGAGAPAVACATAPFQFIGTTTPKRSGAISNVITLYRRLRLYALVDFHRGNVLFNANELLRCSGGFGAQLCEANYYPRNFSPVYLAERTGTAQAQGTIDQYYQDASFFKLREVSATWTFPERWIPGVVGSSITIAARDLAIWTKYAGLDPEYSGATDQGILPQLSRLTATFNIRF